MTILNIFYVGMYVLYALSVVAMMFACVLDPKPSKGNIYNRMLYYSYASIFFVGAGFNVMMVVLNENEIAITVCSIFALWNVVLYNSVMSSEKLRSRFGMDNG